MWNSISEKFLTEIAKQKMAKPTYGKYEIKGE